MRRRKSKKGEPGAHRLVNPIQVAGVAFRSGRKEAAVKILEDELGSGELVETLLKWSENTAAFYKALESGDPDLLYMVMLRLRKIKSPDDFRKTIRNFPVAVTLYKKYCHQFNRQELYEMYVKEKDFGAQAATFISAIVDYKELHLKETLLASASEAYSKGRNAPYARLCEQQLKLLAYQRKLNEKYIDHNFLGRTIHQTCSLLVRSDPNAAEEFRAEFHIPEQRFWWLKIQALAETDDWKNLEKLSQSENCPMGPEKFVDACLQRNNEKEAMKYLSMVPEQLKLKYLIKMRLLEEAAEMAFRKNDYYNLLLVNSLCEHRSELAARVQSMIRQLEAADNGASPSLFKACLGL